ncbi:flavocytochrome c [Shewanella phaeophyticola]|uniref:Flavocytochrome c n=1 Tax=Shewanella phaeophyticola TaxID=2978345 RepID=A0ABT2P6Q1_9GAMM|nr:flavocytochrome c [Shewanella sp. KJ10-1]MCT8988334.1 flavocytochrome c [Shewanella sp. KJ10-1]
MNDRRSFLKKSAGLAAVATGMATILPAHANTLSSTKWDEEVDLLIIGSGFTGQSVAVNANRAGIKVTVLEKMQVIGGNSAINGGWFAVPRNPIQLAQGITDDSPAELVKDQMIAARGMGNEAMLTRIAEKALPAYNMCIEAGVKFKKDFNIQVGGHNKARAIRLEAGTGGGITTKLYEAGVREGVDYRLQHKVEDFIMDGDEILGVVVRKGYRFPNEDTGHLVRIRARKGVVLASGGFARNMKLRFIVDPSLDPTLDCTNQLGATGEATLTAMNHGALPVHMNMIQTGHWGSPDEGGFGWSNALLSIGWHKGIAVNPTTGKRIMDERADRLTCSAAIMACRHKDGSPAYPLVFFNKNDHLGDDRVTRAVRDEMAWEMESLEQLADKFNVPLKQLRSTVEEWNQYVINQKDPDFNRKMDSAVKLEGPFVVSRVWPKVHYCMGGLKTDLDGRVINSSTLAPMKKLYAAGEVTGGVHGHARLSSCACLEGLAMGFIIPNTIKADA